jgi:hypothetical protein
MARAYYLQLPEDLVSEALFEQEVRSRRVSIAFESKSGHVYRIQATDHPEVRLYSLNTSLGPVASDLTTLVDECLLVRAELTGVAAHMGLLSEVPTVTNGKSWPDLGKAIHTRIHEAMSMSACVAGGEPVPTKGN